MSSFTTEQAAQLIRNLEAKGKSQPGVSSGGVSKKPNKYNARKTLYRGDWYDSKAEAEYAAHLDLLVQVGEIIRWERQQTIWLTEYFKVKIDFIVTLPGGGQEARDVKGRIIQRWRDVCSVWKTEGKMPLIEVRKTRTGFVHKEKGEVR